MSLRHHHPTPIPPQRVVILGASGFIARDLVRHLTAEKIAHRAIGSGEIDLLDPACVAQLQTVVEEGDALVITSGLTPDKGRDVATLMKNLTMAQNLATFLETARCAHVIYISSDAVYDGRENPIRESSPRQPSDLYSLMHIAREQMTAFAAAKAKIPLCIFCPCAVYGAGDTHNSYGPNRYFRTALKDRQITLFGNGEEIRDHVFIEDISRLLTLCLTHRSEGTLNAVSGHAVSFREAAEMVAKLCGADVKIACLPRNSAITHRHFDVTERIKAFPSFAVTPMGTALRRTGEGLRGEVPPVAESASPVALPPLPQVSLRGKRVLLVGKNSYVGRFLGEHLEAAGATIIGVGSAECNLLDRDQVRRLLDSLGAEPFSVLFLAVINKPTGNTFSTFLDNVKMLQEFVANLEGHPVEALIYFSSVDVYGRAPSLPISEGTEINPDTWYGLSKSTSEWIVENELGAGVRKCILRLPGVFGKSPVDRSAIGRLITSIRKERKVYIRGDGKIRRDYVFAEDLCRAVEHFIVSDASGVFNLATGRSVSLLQILATIRETHGEDFEIAHLNADSERNFDLSFDIAKLSRTIGEFAFTPLSESIRSYL